MSSDPTDTELAETDPQAEGGEGEGGVSKQHLKGLLEALVFAADHPMKPAELAKASSSNAREVRELLAVLKEEYQGRGIQLDEIAGGFIFRTSPAYGAFVRDLVSQKPVRLSRAQIETLSIVAYRQPVTRPEMDEIRGVDTGPVLRLLLERDLVRILGRKDEPGRPVLYGTTAAFLQFFGLKSLNELPALKEFTELSEDSRRVVERELGETLLATADQAVDPGSEPAQGSSGFETAPADAGEAGTGAPANHEDVATSEAEPAADQSSEGSG